jgi:hypothetical protein
MEDLYGGSFGCYITEATIRAIKGGKTKEKLMIILTEGLSPRAIKCGK